MKTVAQFIETLSKLDPNLPVVVIDTRSGVVDEPSVHSEPTEWSEQDNDYGIELPVGTLVAAIYLG